MVARRLTIVAVVWVALALALVLIGIAIAVHPSHDPGASRVVQHHHVVPVTTTSTSTSTSTTVTPTTTTHVALQRANRSYVRPAPPAARTLPSGDVWAALANCESHMTNEATGNGYYGYFQFSLSTWHSMGLSGNPVDYSYEVQRDAAQRLVERSGWGQFPVCGRRVAH